MASELEVIRGDLTGAIITIQCSCLSKFRNTQEQQDNARGAPQWSWHPRHSQHAQACRRVSSHLENSSIPTYRRSVSRLGCVLSIVTKPTAILWPVAGRIAAAKSGKMKLDIISVFTGKFVALHLHHRSSKWERHYYSHSIHVPKEVEHALG